MLREQKVWYNIKFDRRLLIQFERDADVIGIMRGNDRHAYLYFTGMVKPCAHPIGVSHHQGQGDCEADMAVGGHIQGSVNAEYEML